MRRLLPLFAALCLALPMAAQQKNFSYKFYGFVRGDLYYNTRNNVEAVDGNFYLYPRDKAYDANGKDLNADPNSTFYTFTSRLGFDANGPNLGKAKTSAKIEVDFGGFSLSRFVLRLRHVYVNLDWDSGSSLLIGQTWHPLFGEVMPEVLNLNTGSPFQPFNRSTMLRYRYTTGKVTFTGSAIYQQMYTSSGPEGKSEAYMKNGILPELFAGVVYSDNGFLGGLGIDMISLKPRRQSIMGDDIYKVSERVTSLSLMAQAQYRKEKLFLAAKTLLASNQDHNALLGGYGVSSIDPVTGEQEYTPSRHSTTWVNAVYGNKWRGTFFAGYTKNLGTADPLVSTEMFYGSGVDIDQLTSVSASFSYNLPHWKVGIEHSVTTAWYGDVNLKNGKVNNTHSVTNHRTLGLLIYFF